MITESPEDLELLEGDSAELACEADSDQSLRLTWVWKQDGNELMFSPNYNIQGSSLMVSKQSALNSIVKHAVFMRLL